MKSLYLKYRIVNPKFVFQSRDAPIANRRELGQLRDAIEEAQMLGDDVLSYILVRQGVDYKSNFIIKKFP